MIALNIPAKAEGNQRFVTRLADGGAVTDQDSLLVAHAGNRKIYSGRWGLFELTLLDEDIDGDVVAIDPQLGIAERLVRSGSNHNTFLVTERCDQLCVMCSQPPKKTHVDRWEEFRQAALLSPVGKTLGLSGGEPTLYKYELFDLLDEVLCERPDLSFHVLSNGQHFDEQDIPRLASSSYSRVTWGIPMYSACPETHDEIVVKQGAHRRLRDSLAVMLEAGSHIELRTVVLSSNIAGLPRLAEYIASHMGFIDQWSIMHLEAIGFAKRRFFDLVIDVEKDFPFISSAIDIAQLFGVNATLFNFPLCAVPPSYRYYALPSISDWKRKYAPDCAACTARDECSGFFAWHPEEAMKVTPL